MIVVMKPGARPEETKAVLEKLRNADLNNLNPLEALNLLSDLKKQIE